MAKVDETLVVSAAEGRLQAAMTYHNDLGGEPVQGCAGSVVAIVGNRSGIGTGEDCGRIRIGEDCERGGRVGVEIIKTVRVVEWAGGWAGG